MTLATTQLLLKPKMSTTMILQTKEFYLREITKADYLSIAEILGNSEVMYAYEHPFSEDEINTFIELQQRRYAKYGFGMWGVIIKEKEELIGLCGLTMQDWDGKEVLEIGYLFAKAYWHKGYATKAAQCCKQYAFDVLHATEVYSIIRDTNLPSVKVAIANNMEKVGEFTKFYYNMHMPHFVYCVKKS